IELERPPRDRHVVAAAGVERALEAPLADVAPGTNRVGNDVDIDHFRTLRLSRQCRKTPAAATMPSVTVVSHAACGQPPPETSAPVSGGPARARALEPCIKRPVAAPTSRRSACTGTAANSDAATTPTTAE